MPKIPQLVRLARSCVDERGISRRAPSPAQLVLCLLPGVSDPAQKALISLRSAQSPHLQEAFSNPRQALTYV